MRSDDRSAPGLRIGLVLGGRLIEETLVRELRTITFGQSTKSTLSVPLERLPACWPLFQVVDGGFALCFDDSMDGRLATGDQIRTFAELRARGARRVRGGWSIPLGPNARGKVTAGAATVLFQRVRVAPLPVPTLPPSVRGTFADRINPMLTAIVAVSLLLHGVGAYWLYNRDVKAKTRLDMISEASRDPVVADQYIQIIVPADAVPSPPTAPAVAAPAIPTEGLPDSPSARVARTTPRKVRTGPPADLSDAAIRDIIDNNRALSVLSKRGDATSKFGKMTGKDGAAELDRVIRNVNESGDRVVARAARSPLRTRGAGEAEIGRTDGPAVDGPTNVGAVGPDKRGIAVEPPTIGDVDPLGPGVNPEDIARTIKRRYLKGIQRCHATLIKQDPTAGGRIDIEITTNTVGKVIDAQVDGFDNGLDRCVEGLASRWRFAPAKEAGEPVEATYMVPFILKAPGR